MAGAASTVENVVAVARAVVAVFQDLTFSTSSESACIWRTRIKKITYLTYIFLHVKTYAMVIERGLYALENRVRCAVMYSSAEVPLAPMVVNVNVTLRSSPRALPPTRRSRFAVDRRDQ